jgi:hypothetical protein
MVFSFALMVRPGIVGNCDRSKCCPVALDVLSEFFVGGLKNPYSLQKVFLVWIC